MAIRPASGYERLKQLQQEQKDREEKKTTTYVRHFLRLADGESVELRFLYNLMNENHEAEMIAIKMHEYWVESEGRFVQAVCAEEDGKQCHWCAVAKREIDRVKDRPQRNKAEKEARKEALKNAYQKAARDHFILPCFVYGKDEDGKDIVTPQLLDVKWSLIPSLQTLFETGIASPNGKIKDITVTDFTYARKTEKGRTVYSLVATGYAPRKIAAPSYDRVMQMILEERPIRELDAAAINSNTSSFSDGSGLDTEELDEYPF